jgi:SAM-dependent methyltransferase
MLKRLDDTSDVRIVVGDMSMLPVRPMFADLVVCSLALTHVPVGHLGPVVAEFGRALRPGGRALLSDIHPLVVATGGMAFYRTTAGEGRFVRNHVHWLSDYLAAFAAAGLSVVACEEPRFGPATGVPHLLAAPSPEVDEVAKIAFLDLPGVLVWDLEHK